MQAYILACDSDLPCDTVTHCICYGKQPALAANGIIWCTFHKVVSCYKQMYLHAVIHVLMIGIGISLYLMWCCSALAVWQQMLCTGPWFGLWVLVKAYILAPYEEKGFMSKKKHTSLRCNIMNELVQWFEKSFHISGALFECAVTAVN